MTTIRFPDGFLWGAATSAYQIEGSPLADGAGAEHLASFFSYSRSYHRRRHWRRRVRSLPALCRGCRAHARSRPQRLSLQHRVGSHPAQGTGTVNPRGLDFYDRLLDRVLAHGMQPMVDAVSLGSARRTRRSRRLAQPRHRPVVRGLCANHVSALRRSREIVGHAQRALGRGRRRLHVRSAGPRSSQSFRSSPRLASSHACARRRRASLSRGRQARRSVSW